MCYNKKRLIAPHWVFLFDGKRHRMRAKIILICETCASRNYSTTKPKLATKRLELKKYCAACNRQTLHKESR